MISLNSEAITAETNNNTARRARQLRNQGIDPHLAAIVVGRDDHYVELKQRRGREVGVETSIYRLPEDTKLDDLLGVIGFLNVDDNVHGILVQLPVPYSDKEVEQIINAINPAKDVDGLGTGRIKIKSPQLTELVQTTHQRGGFLPTTAWSMLKLAEKYDLKFDQCLVVGQGRLVGQSLDYILDLLNVEHQVVDLQTKQLAEQIARAKLIFAGTDCEQPIFNRTTVKKDATIIAAGNEIDHDDLANWASALSPSRQGVGPLTIALLHEQTVIAAERAHA